MQKQRLDILLTERGIVESRSQAQRLVMAGQVRVNGQVIIKPDMRIDIGADLILEHGPRFISRGGEKLEAAIQAFNLSLLYNQVCVDVGASTGGFTDCLLQHGAARVYAVDVGYGVLHWKLRSDSRVISMERTNARFVENFPEPIQLVTVDASFISLRILLPVIQKWFKDAEACIIALIKPQFEVGREDAARGEGVIRDPELHRRVLLDLLDFAVNQGFSINGLIRSPLLGPKGNTEFLVYLISPKQNQTDLENLVDTLFI